MRFYKPHTEFYCGVDLHTRNMYPCLLGRDGEVHLHQNMRNDPKRFLNAMKPYRDSLVVSAESTSNWYWLADLCADNEIEFVLGHALYMKAIHGAKVKNDRVDSEKIARLTSSGMLPQAYVYPRQHRCLRDLLRRRLKLVRQRAELYTHIKTVNAQFNLPGITKDMRTQATRYALPERFEDRHARRSVETDLELIEYYTPLIRSLERHIEQAYCDGYVRERVILESIPGIGRIISLTILLEIDQIDRFETRQQFCCYSRLVSPRGQSNGKLYGTYGRKHGNPYLKWAFSEAAICSSRVSSAIDKLRKRLEKKHGKGKGKSLLAHKIGRAVYFMLLRDTIFDMEKFLRT